MKHIFSKRRKALLLNCLHHISIHAVFIILLGACSVTSGQNPGGHSLDLWQTERPSDMANIADLEVMCGKQHMEVTITFDKPFNGIIFSKGAVDRYNCIYVKPQTGFSSYKFDIMYDQCGSKPDLHGRFYENNIVIQYDKDLIEVWDEAKRLRCEWYNDYEKGVTKPPIRVSDLEVVELNFRGDNVDCWMEIQHGKGPWASPVTGIVPLGTTLTMVVGIDDKEGEFDMRVKSCEASDNQNRPIQLSDDDGCVLRPKMVSKFMKMRSSDPRATVVTYAFFHAFKFPDSMAVHIKCKVEICRFGCPDHCQSPSNYVAREQEVSSSLNNRQYQQQQQQSPAAPPPPPLPPAAPHGYFNRQNYQANSHRRVAAAPFPPPPVPPTFKVDPRNRPRIPAGSKYAPRPPLLLPRPSPLVQQQGEEQPRLARERSDLLDEGEGKEAGPGLGNFLAGLQLPKLPSFSSFFGDDDEDQRPQAKNGEAIPLNMGVRADLNDLSTHGRKPSSVPVHRTLNQAQPLVFPSSFDAAGSHVHPIEPLLGGGGQIPYGPRSLNFGAAMDQVSSRQRRRVRSSSEILSRTERSADIGVQSGYDVVSEVDLDFTPEDVDRTVATFQGKIKEDIIYGVCLPATGFSALFVLFALMTVVSVIVSGFICYHRQLAKVAEEAAPEPGAATVLHPAAVMAAATAAAAEQPSFMLKEWGFNTWFRNKQQERPPIYRQ